MPEILTGLFMSEGFMPHGHCYLWDPSLIGLHVVSDGLITLAYTSIPFTLLYVSRRRKDLPFNWMLLCFGIFIVACGTTHAMEIWTLWTPLYWLSGAIKAITAAASVTTAVLLVRLVPSALAIPTATQLARAHEELRRAHEELETRVLQRTAELTRRNEDLAREILERQRAEDALRASEARFRKLTESGIIGMIVSDTEGNIHEANDAFLALTGYTRDDLTAGRLHGSMLNTPDSSARQVAALAELRATGLARPWEKELVRKDGHRVPALVGVTMVDASSCVSLVLDLTEQKRAEQAIRALETRHAADVRFQSLLEAAPEAMVIVDEKGKIVLVNAQTQRLFGYARTEMLGQAVEMLVPPAARTQHLKQRDGYAAHPEIRAMGAGRELNARRKDGSEFPAEISLSPLQTPDGMLVSSAIRDATERRRTEEMLRRSKDAAVAASAELEAFSYSVAHDLRTPLRGINGLSTALLEDVGDQLSGSAREYLDRIASAAARMGTMIDALLDLSRVSRVELQRQPVDLSELARAVVLQMQTAEPERARSVECVVEDGLVAWGDAALLRVLLDNLIGNAWKFVGKRERGRIELGRAAQAPGAAFFVRDNGAGFDMAHAQRLFVPFQRLHGVAEFTGSGIGLATVQRIVRRHGGNIWAEGAVDEGATFVFTLEAAGAPAGARA